MSGGGAFNQSGSNSKSQSGSYFPSQFLGSFENRYGRGVSTDELMGMLPQTQSIFGGGPIGYGFTGGQPGQPGGAGQPGQPGQPGGQPSGGFMPDGKFTLDTINQLTNEFYQGKRPKLAADVAQRVTNAAKRAGLDIGQGLTADQLRSLPGVGDFIQQTLPSLGAPTGQQGPRYAPLAGQPDIAGLKIPQRIDELFGANAQEALQGYKNWSTVPTVTSMGVNAEQANIAPQGYDAYQQSLYNSMVNPMLRTLNIDGDIADRRLQGDLAGAGLASSGTGIGQLEQQRRTRSEQVRSVALEAADRATQQRFGAEFAQEQFNAQQRQTANIERAGFDLDAQKANAVNILTGDQTKSDAYTKTLGLNTERTAALRNDFLELMGITQKEMERLDARQMDTLGLFLNNWLQQGALFGNLGNKSQSQASQQSIGVQGHAGLT